MDPSFEVIMIIIIVIVFHVLIFRWLTRKSKSIDGKFRDILLFSLSDLII